jgi:hypothetical protein
MEPTKAPPAAFAAAPVAVGMRLIVIPVAKELQPLLLGPEGTTLREIGVHSGGADLWIGTPNADQEGIVPIYVRGTADAVQQSVTAVHHLLGETPVIVAEYARAIATRGMV